MSTWRAGCGEGRTSGSEGGPEKPIARMTTGRSGPTPTPTCPPGRGSCTWLSCSTCSAARSWGGPWPIIFVPNWCSERSTWPSDSAAPQRWSIIPTRGAQYTSLAFGKRCRQMGVLTSTGTAGDCYDNAMAESFFATLECELIARQAFQTQAEAPMAVFPFIEGWYNPRRRHSALGYLSPNDFERVAEAAVARHTDHGRPDGKTALEVSLIRESGVPDDPPALPAPAIMDKALLPVAIAHLSARADSPQLSTETG